MPGPSAAPSTVRVVDGDNVAAVPEELAVAIARALQPTAIFAFRRIVAGRVRKHGPFAFDPIRWAELAGAIEDAERDTARRALRVLAGPARAAEIYAVDPTAESAAPDASLAPPARAGGTRRRDVAGSVAAAERYERQRAAGATPVQRRPALPVQPVAVAHRTVVDVGLARSVPRAPHERSRREIQRWVTDTRSDPPRILRVPQLQPGTMETERWRDELRFGELVCPWPGCPAPELTLRAGPVVSTHVAHRPGAQDHGTHTDWVLSTLARLEDLTDQTAVTLGSAPPTVSLGDLVVTLLHERLGPELEAAAQRALSVVPTGCAPVAVLRASLLPRRFAPVRVYGESTPRWAFPTRRDRTLRAIEALRPFSRVLGAPDLPHADDEGHQMDPRWGSRWIGLGLEDTPQRGHLDWGSHGRSPLVALTIDGELLGRALRPSATTLGPARSTVAVVEAPGVEMEPVGFEAEGPTVRCRHCRFSQKVADGLSTDEVEAILDRIEDEDEQAAELERHDVLYCVYDACPRCGDGVDRY